MAFTSTYDSYDVFRDYGTISPDHPRGEYAIIDAQLKAERLYPEKMLRQKEAATARQLEKRLQQIQAQPQQTFRCYQCADTVPHVHYDGKHIYEGESIAGTSPVFENPLVNKGVTFNAGSKLSPLDALRESVGNFISKARIELMEKGFLN